MLFAQNIGGSAGNKLLFRPSKNGGGAGKLLISTFRCCFKKKYRRSC